VAYAKADDDGGVVVRTGDFEKLLRTALGLPEVDAVGAASADSSVQLLAELKNRLKQKDVEAKEKALKKPEKKK